MRTGWIWKGTVAAGRGLLFYAIAVPAHTALIVLTLLSLALVPLGVGLVALPVVAEPVRALTNLYRRTAANWFGVVIPVPYQPKPDGAPLGSWRRFRWVVADPATWRNLVWLLLTLPTSLLLGLVPAAVVLYGVEGVFLLPLMIAAIAPGYGYAASWPIDHPVDYVLVLPQGAAILGLGLVLCRRLLRTQVTLARGLLRPTRAAALTLRVEQLAASRSGTVDAQAAELRRIERDLHDGVQARLVAVGMTLGLAEELTHRDPEAVQRLLTEAREASGQALVELRDLVRGIHPPVLSERGLAGAVEALAMTVSVPVEVAVDLPGRPRPPVESAAYFAVAEALANVLKHSGATRAEIRLWYADGQLCMLVRDDGRGGADPGNGTGLRGIESRLAAFDGTMTVTSPHGGPTVVTMELPCALSSPKITPSSGTD